MTRIFATTMTALTLVMMAQGVSAQSMTAKTAMPTTSMSAKEQIMPIRNEGEYRTTLFGPATVSLETSQMAVEKATNPKVKEFARFEVAEQTALGTVLKELNTSKSDMPAKDKTMIQRLEAAQGAAFDRAYVQSSLEGHELLRAITESYLKNGNPASREPMEMEARHLAMVSLQTIKQHIVNAQELLMMLK